MTEQNTKTTLGYERCEVRITNLKPFTTYRVAVKAFNSIGPGPDSDFIRVTTNEGGKVIFIEINIDSFIQNYTIIYYLNSTRRTSAKRPMFTIDGGIFTDELGSATNGKPPRYDTWL